MSNRRRIRPKRVSREAIAEAAQLAAVARGCTCSEIELQRQHVAPGVYLLDVRHDDGCPALDEADR